MSQSLRHLLPLARTPSADPPGRPRTPRRRTTARRRDRLRERGRQGVVVVLLAVVIAADQAAKWWAWRHVPWAQINSGGDILTGRTIGEWYAGPVSGSLLDLLDLAVVSFAVLVLARWQASAAVLPGSLMTGGWASNLLDRLGVHHWTAPGSARGAVDFIHAGGYYYNIADFFIAGCTPLFLLAAGYQAVQAARRRHRPASRASSASAVPG